MLQCCTGQWEGPRYGQGLILGGWLFSRCHARELLYVRCGFCIDSHPSVWQAAPAAFRQSGSNSGAGAASAFISLLVGSLGTFI